MIDKQNLPPSLVALKSQVGLPIDKERRNRVILRDAGVRKLAECEKVLAELIDTYQQVGRSTSNPMSCFTSTALQVAKLRKSLAGSNV